MSLFELSLLLPVVIIGIIVQICIWVYALMQLVQEMAKKFFSRHFHKPYNENQTLL